MGRGVRSPDVTERFIILLPIGYDRYDYLGNPQLKPEVNYAFDLGYRFRNNQAGNFEVSGFFSYIQDFISGQLLPPTVMKPQTKGVLGVKEFVNLDNAFMTGFEFSYNTPAVYDWGILFNASYTLGWNPEAVVHIYEDGKVVDEQLAYNDPLPEIPPLELFIRADYKLFEDKFIPALSLRMVASQDRISEAFNEQNTPGFILLNLDLTYRFNKYLSVYAGVKNLFNVAYYEHLNRNIIGTTYPLYEPGRIFYGNLVFKF
jgi:iron complex outermembrane receptor protein